MCWTPRVDVDFNAWGKLAEPRGRRTCFTLAPDPAQLKGWGVEPTDGLEVLLHDEDADDAGEPLWLLNDGELVWEKENERWLAAFDPDAFRHVPRSYPQPEDGDWVTITFKNGGELEVEWCNKSVVLARDGKPCLQFYIYRPDACTDLARFEDIASIRPVLRGPRRKGGDGT